MSQFDYVKEWEQSKNRNRSEYHNIGAGQNLLFHVDFHGDRLLYRIMVFYRTSAFAPYNRISDEMDRALFPFVISSADRFMDDLAIQDLMKRANSFVKLKAFW